MERASGEFRKKLMTESRVSARRKRCERCARTDGEHATSKTRAGESVVLTSVVASGSQPCSKRERRRANETERQFEITVTTPKCFKE